MGWTVYRRVTYLNPINCSDGGAVLAGCAAFVVVASSHHSGKAARKLEKLSGDGQEEEDIDRLVHHLA